MASVDTAQPVDVAARKAWIATRLGELGEQINAGRDALEEAKTLIPEARQLNVGGPSRLQRLLHFSLTGTTIARYIKGD